MWESVARPPRGRISLRHIALWATSLTMALFLAVITQTSTVLAVDAQRSGDTVTYDGKVFKKVVSTQIPSPGTDGYQYIDTATQTAYFLLTSGNPDSASSAVYTKYDSYVSPTTHGPPTVIAQNVTIATSSSTVPPTTNNATPSPSESNGSTDTPPSEDAATCDGDQTGGLGWILCPVVNFLAKGTDFIYKIIADFLVVRTTTADTNSSLYKMWDLVRSIANVCFIIAFLVIVYSQITGYGLSNYNLKKMLPRLIIGAILVNLSFWVCALAVDASNIIGYSIHQMFNDILAQFNSGSAYANVKPPSWQSVAVAVLSGGAIIGGIGFAIASSTFSGALFLLFPILVGVLLSALVALVILSARQAIIICLIIISPLAFVAMLLPNTEKYFDKWKDTMLTMLFLYPIFSIVFSGAHLAGMVIIQNAGDNIITIILGMAVMVAPLVITPLLVKFSGGLLGRIAGIVNNPNKGLVDRTRNWSKGMAEERRNKALSGISRDGTIKHRRRHAATRYLDTRRRARDGRRKAYENLAEARYSGTHKAHDIEAMSRDAENIKTDHSNRFAASDRGMKLDRTAQHLAVDKQNIATKTLTGPEGHALRTRQRDADTYKTNAESQYAQTKTGQQAEYRSRMAGVRKDLSEAKFEETDMGQRIDTIKREVQRRKQLAESHHEQSWNFRNQTDAGSQEREMRLRIAADETSLSKAKVDADYAELKLKQGSATVTGLGDQAYRVALETSLTSTRAAQAQSELTGAINKAILTNGTEYARNADGTIQVDVSGNKVTVGAPISVDGKDIHTYAAGIGKHEIMLANAVAADRADWGKQAQAAGELQAHFKLDSGQIQTLAAKGKGTLVKATDDNGNEFTFDAGDEYVKEAAISKQFKAGSYGQKMAILEETGEKVIDRDADGNIRYDDKGRIVYRKGHNYHHRATAQSDAISSGIAGLAPFINDVTYNEILKGNFSKESVNMHALRQIFEGRLKANNLTGANQDALKILFKMGRLQKSSNPADQAEFNSYKQQMIQLFADVYGTSSQAYKDATTNFDDKFEKTWQGLLQTTKGIMENSTLNSNTSDEAKTVMRDILESENVKFRER